MKVNYFLNIRTQNINNVLLLSFAFFISVSIYITDLIILLFIISWIVSGNYKEKIKAIIKSPFIYPSIIFFCYFMSSYLWADNSLFNDTTQKQALLLLSPILLTSNFNSKYITKAKYAFLGGLLINIFLSIVTLFMPQNSFFKDGHYENNFFAHGFIDHFDYSIFLCFGIFILTSLLNKKNWLTISGIIIIFLCVLLNSYGRVGIISFFIFFPIILLLYTKFKFKKTIISFICLFICFSYYFFQPFQVRVNETINSLNLISEGMSLEEKILKDAEFMSLQSDSLSVEYFIHQIKKDPDWLKKINIKHSEYTTSLGQRYLYVKNSIDLIPENLFFGTGVGGFHRLYKYNFNNIKHVKHPHNNFIFITIELGLIGLLIMLNIFYRKILFFVKSPKNCFLELIFPLFFLFIMLFDNYFLNHNTLAFYCLFATIIYWDHHSKKHPIYKPF